MVLGLAHGIKQYPRCSYAVYHQLESALFALVFSATPMLALVIIIGDTSAWTREILPTTKQGIDFLELVSRKLMLLVHLMATVDFELMAGGRSE